MKLLIILLPLIGGLIKASRYGKNLSLLLWCYSIFTKKKLPRQFWKGVVICILTCVEKEFNDIADVQRESKHNFIWFLLSFVNNDLRQCSVLFLPGTHFAINRFLFLWEVLIHSLYSTLGKKYH